MNHTVDNRTTFQWKFVFLLPVIALILITFAYGCKGRDSCTQGRALSSWMQDNGKIKVLCSIAMIGDIVEEIGGDLVDVHTLISGQLDPHSYQLVKGDGEKLDYADIIIYNGLGLEHGANFRRRLQEEEKAVAYGEYIVSKDSRAAIAIGGVLDPHIWMDMSLWVRGIEMVVDVLSAHQPDHAAEFAARGKTITQQLLSKHDEIRSILQAVPVEKRYLVSSHDAFNYFARVYLATADEATMEDWGPRCRAPEGLAPESQLSSHDIRDIIDHVERYNIHVLFPESNVSRDSIRKILDAGKERGLKLHMSEAVLYGDAMACQGVYGDTYLTMMEHNARTIAGELMKE